MRDKIYRNRKYLDAVREMRCIFTGQYGTEFEAVDPAHLGSAGRSIKSPDDEVLPVIHSLHTQMHQVGEITVLRNMASDGLLRAMARAYAREIHRDWKDDQG